MITHTALVFSVVIAVARSAEDLNFPPEFKFGVASSAYQVEGAWNVSDKGENIWDRFCHEHSELIANGSNGDVACDSYHLWKEHIDMVADVGVQFYKISIAWTRLLPSGFADRISDNGKKYYSNLIDGLLEKGIEPVVTLYHWDLPQLLQDLGGWSNPHVSVWFADYARVVFSLFGDRVKTWITINEVWLICDIPYMTGLLAPGIVSHRGAYLCLKNVLMAHAMAWRIYNEDFKDKYHGEVSISNHVVWMEPADESEEELAENIRQLQVGLYSHPIYSKDGGWPPVVEKRLAVISEVLGYPRSILPAFTKEEIELVKGTYDYYGMSMYSSRLVRRAAEDEDLRPWPMDCPHFDAKLGLHPDWPTPLTEFFGIHPEGIRKQLAWLKKEYGDIPIFITENGRGTQRTGLNDIERIEYYRDYLKQILLAIKEDGVNVTGYTAWTIMDSFEWRDGYTTKFGLYEVDFSSPQRTRTPRASAKYYASVVKSHSLDVPYNFTIRETKEHQDSKTHYIVTGGLAFALTLMAVAALLITVERNKKPEYVSVNTETHQTNAERT